ncbi:MAG: serine/threonine-protein kinase, partial [Polyangiaceae bacterium]
MTDGAIDTLASAAKGDEELARGAMLDRYLILRRLGRGGMGVVYLSLDVDLERRIAIKVLRPQAAHGISVDDARARLLREAQAMAKVSHANVVTVFDVGTIGDEVFIAMEYMHGSTLRQWRAGGGRSKKEIVAAYVQAGRGLEAAHAAGIFHRDFKPDNAIIDARGRVKVFDFGLARLERSADGDAEPGEAGSRDGVTRTAENDTALPGDPPSLSSPLTREGRIVGTPEYMAPEQLTGVAATARSDQFSFCVALYEALYGVRPFVARSNAERLQAIRGGRLAEPPTKERVPVAIRRALVRGLHAAPEKRFETMGELLGALERASAPPRWLGASAVGVVLLATIGLAAARSSTPGPCRGAPDAIAPAWSAARADQVERAFAATGNVRAKEAFAHMRPLLDRYAGAWVAAQTDACLATRVRGVQSDEALDLRTACLGQRAQELRATVDLFTHADARMVDDAVLAASHLDPVAACDDVAALRATYAPPKDASERRSVEELRRRLAELDALFLAGRYEQAEPLANALSADAARVGYAPVHAEVELRRGRILGVLDRSDASGVLEGAALEADGAADDATAAEAWVKLADLAGNRYAHDDAARYARLADAKIRRLRRGEELRVKLLEAESWDAYKRGATADALALAREALALAERASVGADLILIARSRVADALWDKGEIEDALATYQALHADYVALLGETHPASLRSLTDIGEAQTELGDYDAALRTLEPLRVISFEREPMVGAYGRVLLAEALAGAGRHAEAIAMFDASDAVMRERAGEGETTAENEADFARALVQSGATREAEAYANRAVGLLGRSGGR